MPKNALLLSLSTATLMLGGCLDTSVYEPDAGSETTAEPDGTTLDATWPDVLTTTEGMPEGDETSGGAPTLGECEPGMTAACPYGGPAENEGVGACKAAMRTCGDDGAWRPCRGEVLPRAEDCRTQIDESCDGSVSCDGQVVWARGFGEAPDGEPGSVSLYGLTVDGDGRVWLAGRFSESLRFGEQTWDAASYGTFMMAGIDGDGVPGFSFGDEQVGAFGFGGRIVSDGGGRLGVSAGYQGHLKIHPDSPDYQTNEVTPSVVVGMLTTAGAYRWSRALRPEYSAAVSIHAMAFDGAGNLWVAGDFGSGDLAVGSPEEPVILANHGGEDAFLLEMSPDGELIWADRFGDEQEQEINGIAVDAAGSVWLTGGFMGAMQFKGGAVYALKDEQDSQNMFIVKLDASGTWQWGRALGDGKSQRFLRIRLDRDGNAVVGGENSGTVKNLGAEALVHEGPGSSPVVAKFDPEGKVLWAREWACDGYCAASSLAVDGAGQSVGVLSFGWGNTLIVDGQTFTADPDESGAIVVKLDREGDIVWVSDRVPGDPEVAVDALGEVLLAGDFKTYASFGDGKFQLNAGVGDTDLYVLKMRP